LHIILNDGYYKNNNVFIAENDPFKTEDGKTIIGVYDNRISGDGILIGIED
jgi:hypothetical protein